MACKIQVLSLVNLVRKKKKLPSVTVKTRKNFRKSTRGVIPLQTNNR